jgi:hypothetical protein
VVDAWASIEGSELYWMRTHQKEIRSDLYQNIRDMVGENDNAPTDLGQHGIHIVLPSSGSGSSRHMYQLFQDSMAICRFCQQPDLFITMTANPSWPEIQEALLEFDGPNDDPDGPRRQQTATDHPVIVARVFRQKIKSLLEDIQEGIFGEVLGLIYTNEFQK